MLIWMFIFLFQSIDDVMDHQRPEHARIARFAQADEDRVGALFMIFSLDILYQAGNLTRTSKS